MKVLLGQLGSNGDCLYATILAHQIKADYPKCHLTWAVSSLCKGVIRNNPHVDRVQEIQVDDWADQEAAWYNFEADVQRRQNGNRPEYDKVILSQIWPNNFRYYDGTIRPSILRAYGAPITVPVDNVICLDDEEIQNVEDYRGRHGLASFDNVVIFECSSKSGQSYVTPEFAQQAAELLTQRLPNTCVILASHIPIDSGRKDIIDASVLSMREIAGLTHHAHLFVGCGSGLTVIATSGSSNTLPNIQLLLGGTSAYASFAHDFEYFNKPADHFVEMYDAPADVVADAMYMTLKEGVRACRQKHHAGEQNVTFEFYSQLVGRWLMQPMKYADAARSTKVAAKRYGWRPDLLHFARYVVAPKVMHDPTCRIPDVRREMEAYLDEVMGV